MNILYYNVKSIVQPNIFFLIFHIIRSIIALFLIKYYIFIFFFSISYEKGELGVQSLCCVRNNTVVIFTNRIFKKNGTKRNIFANNYYNI